MLALLLLVLIAAVYFAVKTATTQAVERQAQLQLKIGTRVFERLLDLRGRNLQYGVDWLVVDSEFRRAVLSGKPVDILAALAQHSGGIRSSEMFVLSPEGRVIASTLPVIARDQHFPYDQALRRAMRHNTHMLFVAIKGRPYLLVQGEVLESLPIARVVMGFPMDELFAQELRSMSNLEVSFLTVDGQHPGELFSTQPEFFWSPIINVLADSLWQSLPQLSETHGQRFLNQALQLANTGDAGDPRVMALLQSPLEQALQAFAPLDREFMWIAMVALVVSLVCALLMARRVSRPLEDLAQAARRIGAGNYQAR
ncbi:hypothetical protein PBOI14_62520 [Pseudomonas sp. Boi14]|nr:hypothetical protein PBOI14_62520 [Pseudomonas sp. Boi14]